MPGVAPGWSPGRCRSAPAPCWVRPSTPSFLVVVGSCGGDGAGPAGAGPQSGRDRLGDLAGRRIKVQADAVRGLGEHVYDVALIQGATGDQLAERGGGDE